MLVIRLCGESKELKDEGVQLVRHWGVVTPYTAMLIIEDEKLKIPLPPCNVTVAASGASGMKLAVILAAAFGSTLLAVSVIAAPDKAVSAASMPAGTQPASAEFAVTHVIPCAQEGRDWHFVGVEIDREGKLLYLVGRAYTLVEDATTGKELAKIANSWGNGLALVPEAGRGFISTGQWGLIVFDLKTHLDLGRVSVDHSGLGGMIYDPASNRLLVMKAGGDSLLPIAPDIDLKTGQAEKQIQFQGQLRDMVPDGRGMVYVTVARSDTSAEHVAVLDTREMKIATTWPIPPGVGNASGISMDPLRSRLFIACNGHLLIMSATDGHTIAQLPIGTVPGGYAGSGTTAYSGGKIFASCGDGTLTVVGQNAQGSFEVEQALPGISGVTAMAVHPLTRALYVPTLDGGKMQPPPGFKILLMEKRR